MLLLAVGATQSIFVSQQSPGRTQVCITKCFGAGEPAAGTEAAQGAGSSSSHRAARSIPVWSSEFLLQPPGAGTDVKLCEQLLLTKDGKRGKLLGPSFKSATGSEDLPRNTLPWARAFPLLSHAHTQPLPLSGCTHPVAFVPLCCCRISPPCRAGVALLPPAGCSASGELREPCVRVRKATGWAGSWMETPEL